ncbi:ATP synthase F1 subunit delta [Sulfoacidibacillus thermotolerans]|uniref:ATP synthase subunit delta n=1 Tax=Sulfoacidibacillus thermotolerans TaxID=1765684 RepID=A0A2U3D9M0_SULT2|nr:ATP synthase F1 subunit delta [Sulfoacidibacillus thermotolerans]PWI57978.1 ATP synthase F1 subunit delta [Sulfoacidibacillus thermotolerans]
MLIGAITHRYTGGLYAAAQAADVIEPVDAGLREIAQAIDAYPSFKLLLEHPVLTPDVKMQVVRNVFGDSLPTLLQNFIHLLFVRHRSEYLRAIYESYHQMADEAQGRIEVQVESARVFDEEQLLSLREQLAKALQKEVQATVEVRPELIAGYRVHVGNRIIDATVRGALTQFSHKLLVNQAAKEGTF